MRFVDDELTGAGEGWGDHWLNVRYESEIGRRDKGAFMRTDPGARKAITEELEQAWYMAQPVVHTGAAATDVVVRALVRLQGPVEAGLLARWSYDQAYALMVRDDRVSLYRFDVADRTVLARRKISRAGGWIALRLELRGERLDGSLAFRNSGNEITLSAADPQPLGAGLVGALIAPLDDLRGGRSRFREFRALSSDALPPVPEFAYRFSGAVIPEGDGYSARISARTVLPGALSFDVATDDAFSDARRVGPFEPTGRLLSVHGDVDALEEDTRYFWRPVAASGDAEVLGPPASFRTPGPAGSATRFVFASCTSGREGLYPSFATARDLEPDFYLHAGDWGYADQNSVARRADHFQARWTRLLRIGSDLFDRTPLLFWQDDHDYQADNGWAETIQPYTVTAFDELHANPTDTYFDLRWGDVQVWCIDCRLFAGDPAAPDDADKSRLGAEQKRWLMDSMAASKAPVRVVASPMVFRNKRKDDPGWHSVYTHERDELLAFFASLDAVVVILSGDSHGQRLIHHFEYGELYEINSSGTDFPHGGNHGNHDPEHTQINVTGRNGFALVELDPAGPGRKLRVRSIASEDGETLFEKVFPVPD